MLTFRVNFSLNYLQECIDKSLFSTEVTDTSENLTKGAFDMREKQQTFSYLMEENN